MHGRLSWSVLIVALGVAGFSQPATAHVDYVTDGADTARNAISFAVEVLSNPVNLALVVGTGVATAVGLGMYIWFRPTVTDIVVLREKLVEYTDLIPWMLRLSIGLPLVGAGFQGYLFAPTVTFDTAANPVLRVLFIGVGFCLLFGLATRTVSSVGLVTYGWALTADPAVILAMEYVPGFLAILVLGGGRPSADDMLQSLANTEGTLYGRIDPVHRIKNSLDVTADPFRRYVPVIVRVGLGVSFVYLGIVQKLGQPGSALQVVEKYNLTAVVPVDPGMWVLGAGLAETAVGLALITGFLARGAASVSFFLFTTTLFGLPDDPVLAHVTLFGLASVVFTMGAGPYSLDSLIGRPARTGDEAQPAD